MCRLIINIKRCYNRSMGKKKLTLEEVNERLREANSEYECTFFDGTRSNKSVFKHIESDIERESSYNGILSGRHPSWSPTYKKQKKDRDLKKTLTLEECKETFWNVRPNKRGLVEVFEKKTINGRTHVILKETETGRIGKPIRWRNAINPKKEGVPDTFKCHPHSLESKTETFWNVHPKLRGKVKVNKKWCKNGITWVELKELSSDETHEMNWSQAIDPSLEGVPPHFDCYDGTMNRATNDKLSKVYLGKTKTYGARQKKRHDGPFITPGKTAQGSAKQRYGSNGHLETYFEFETYDCDIHEKAILSKVTALIGPPDAGYEAWKWTQEREDAIKKIFLDHFLKDYIDNV